MTTKIGYNGQLEDMITKCNHCQMIRIIEVKLRKMRLGKALGPNGIEVWKCLGDKGLKWLIIY